MSAQRDTIYIDVDDEITAIIGKMQASSSKIVALVLPKRAAALQSIVNMKLLKRTADDADKTAVLITSEAGLLPLAGATGVYVAKTLQSKPEVPDEPDVAEKDQEEVAELGEEESDDSAKTVSKVAGAAAVEDTVELDDEVADTAKASTKPKKKGSKTPKIPNFEKFRAKLFIAIAAVILLIGLWYVAVFAAAKARVVIKTDSETLNASTEFTASPNANSLNLENKTAPAEFAEIKKEDTQEASATGEKDIGDKATGTLTMTAKNCSGIATPSSVPAGTKVTSNSKTFTTNSAATFSFDDISGGCVYFNANTVGFTAQQAGTDYNLSSTSFTVSGRSDVTATGSTSGGTSNVVKVVSKQDVDDAKAKLETDEDSTRSELAQQITDQGLFPIKDSMVASDESTDISPAIGEQADKVEVKYSAKFTMAGVNRQDLSQILEQSIKDQIDPDRQQIQEDGLDQATFTIKNTKSDGTQIISVSTTLAIGPKVDLDQLKTEIAGKKRGETEDIVRRLPGVNDVTVDYSPFWVSKTPTKPEKISIEFEEVE